MLRSQQTHGQKFFLNLQEGIIWWKSFQQKRFEQKLDQSSVSAHPEGGTKQALRRLPAHNRITLSGPFLLICKRTHRKREAGPAICGALFLLHKYHLFTCVGKTSTCWAFTQFLNASRKRSTLTIKMLNSFLKNKKSFTTQ